LRFRSDAGQQRAGTAAGTLRLLGDASARLACYDGLTKGPVLPVGSEVAALPADPTQPPAPPAAPVLPPKLAQLAVIPPAASISRMVQWWELDRASKRGVFNFRPIMTPTSCWPITAAAPMMRHLKTLRPPASNPSTWS
jgi:hypothetical protein